MRTRWESRFMDWFLACALVVALGLAALAAVLGPRREERPITASEWAGAPETIWVEEAPDVLRPSVRLGPRKSSERFGWGEIYDSDRSPRFVGVFLRNTPRREDLVGYAASERLVDEGEGLFREFRRLGREETLQRVGADMRVRPGPR